MEFWLNYIIIILVYHFYIKVELEIFNLKLVSKSNDFFLDSLGRIVRKWNENWKIFLEILLKTHFEEIL